MAGGPLQRIASPPREWYHSIARSPGGLTMFMYWPDNRPWSYHFMARLINAAQLGGACFHESHRTAPRIRPHDGESWYAEWRGGARRGGGGGRAPAAARPGPPGRGG